MDLITRFSLKNAAVIVIATLLVTFGGLYSARQLKRETMPDVSIPIVAVVTPYPGAAPADVYEKVTKPIEQGLSAVEGLETLQSTSNDSVSVVIAEFSFSADMDEAEAKILEALDPVKLPENVIPPSTSRVSMGSQPILRFAIAGGESPEELQRIVSETVVPALKAIDGVGEINVSNDEPRNVRIVFDADKLDEKGLTAEGVVQQLQAANLSFPVGSVEIGSVESPIRVSGTLDSVEDIREFQVAIYPDMNSMFFDAFEAMGEGVGAMAEGMGQLGSGMGAMAEGMGELGSGVGDMADGMGAMAEGMGMQIGLVAALQDVQGQLLEAKIQYSDVTGLIRDLESQGATATPEYVQAQMMAMQLEQVIPALEQAEAAIIAEMQAAAQAPPSFDMPTDMEMPAGFDGMPSMDLAMPAAPASMGSIDMGELTIETVELGDVAEVTYGASEDAVYARADGRPAVLVDIVKTQDANTVDVSGDIQEEMDRLVAQLPGDTEVTYTFDGAVMINDSISDVLREGIMGAALAFIIILIFLRNWRSTLIAAISIPLSVVISLLFMRQAGVTMNVMTLGGLTVAIGRVVDDSIVVIENVYNHLQAGSERTMEMVRAATAEVSSAITSSTLTTVAVFAPMALVSGIVGKIFVPFALTVALALLSSLLVAVTVVPLLAKWSLLGADVRPRDERATRTGRAYRRGLEWALDRPGIVVTVATLLFVGSLALIPVIGVGFMPPATEKFISVDVEYPAGSGAEQVDAGLAQIETGLAERDAVDFYTISVETGNGFNMMSGITGGNTGTVFIKLHDDADVDAELAWVQQQSGPLAEEGAKVTAAQVSMAGGSENALQIIVTGPSIDDIETAVDDISGALVGVAGLENVSSNLSEKRPQVTVDVDAADAAEEGLNAAMVAGTVRGYVAEQSAGTIQVEGRDAELLYVTRLDEVTAAEDIADREIASPLGEGVRIGDIAEVEQVDTPVSVLTRNEREYAAVNGSITVRDTGSVLSEIESRIDGLDLPDGVEVEMAGVASMMSESFTQLGLAMLIAVAAVYLVMVITFGESIAPLAIMFSLPLAVIGGIVGLLLGGMPLDMPAMIGALMLIGIVTTNAIMFVERVNQKLAEGSSRREALLDAGTNRMRPILMTALTTIFALVPMAFGIAEGALMSQSLAVIVVGGLTTSTVLTLIVVPVIYDLLENLKERILGSRNPQVKPVELDA